MLAGEYSVLAPGGEALALAVEAGVEARATPAERWEIQWPERDQRWREGDPWNAELRFALAALQQARRAGDGRPPLSIVTRTLGGAGTGRRKPGVGGSASATAAVAAAVLGEPLEHTALLRHALAAHLQAQGGHGSGYDVATAVFGGLVRWRPGEAGQGQAARVSWPNGLYLLFGYSGASASTSGLLGRLKRRRRDAPGAHPAAELVAPTRRLIEAFAAGQPDAILQRVRASHEAFSAWDRRLRMGAVTDQIAQMARLAQQCGAAVKVSGAGGGDSVLALASHPARLARLERAWRAAGFTPLDVDASREGVRCVSAG
jgi:mevalonate kinase